MWSLFWFVILVGILIFAHEGGHFLFAKLFKVKVLTFSLGFGSPIGIGKFRLSIRPRETEYRIAWFPIGGFVRMLGEDPTQEVPAEDLPRAFSTQKPWKRFLIIFGGPLFSVLLAVPIYFVVHVAHPLARGSVVGRVLAGSPAARAGVLPGDTLRQIGNREIQTWEDADEAVQATAGMPADVTVDRQGESKRFSILPEEEWDETGLDLLGQRWDVGWRHERQGLIVGVVSPDSPAAQAGVEGWDMLLDVGGVEVRGWTDAERLLDANGQQPVPLLLQRVVTLEAGAASLHLPALVKVVVRPAPLEAAPPGTWRTKTSYFGIEPIDMYVRNVSPGLPGEKLSIVTGDKLISMFGQPLDSWEQFSRTVQKHSKDAIPLQIRHEGKLRDLTFTPATIEQTNEFRQTTQKPGLGVEYTQNLVEGNVIPRPGRLGYAAAMAILKTGEAMKMNVLGFVRIFQGRVAASEAIGGPGMMLMVAGKTAKQGWDAFLGVMAFISVLLGLLNLLPIPILDGGHLAFILVEVIRRRPLSLQARLVASYVGLALLVALMAFAIGNDIHRYWPDITSIFG